jgi:hypothetical protein
MKYIITERQSNIIKEIERESGHFEFEPLDSFFEYMDNQVSKKQKIKLFKDFFREKMGFGVEEDDFLLVILWIISKVHLVVSGVIYLSPRMHVQDLLISLLKSILVLTKNLGCLTW